MARFHYPRVFLWLLPLAILAGAVLWWWPVPVLSPLSLPSIQGKKIHLPDSQGRYSWVNMWSSSCAACLKELPDLDALHREYGERLQVVAIAMPYDPPNTVVETRDRLQLTLPLALDLDGQAARQFAADLVVPASHLLDPQGRIVYSVRGALSHDAMLAVLKKYKLENGNHEFAGDAGNT